MGEGAAIVDRGLWYVKLIWYTAVFALHLSVRCCAASIEWTT